MDDILPRGYAPLFRSSPFLDLLGPLYYWQDDQEGMVIALRVEQKHCNQRGTAHGGLLCSLADVALGYSTAYSREPPLAMATVNLNLDFCGAARLGDLLEVRTHIQKIGQRLAFASASIDTGEQPVARASAVFHIP
ncbi:PaaI family thioesterase [Pseudomonas sp. BN417]|nr:PaaI family thioesterase [Pseudomonas sp. BN417]